MKAKVLNSNYERSRSVVVHGRDVERYESMGYERGNGGYGTYRMNKPAIASITFEAGDSRYHENISGLIKDYYGMQRISRQKFEQFVESCKNGFIDLQYSDNYGLYIN